MRVRTAVLADAEALALVHVRGWQAAYRGEMPQEYLDGLDPVQRAQTWRQWLTNRPEHSVTIVLEDGAEGVVGFVNVDASRDSAADPTVGEIAAIYLLPSHWSRGGGRLLMAEALRHLASAGFREATLWVLTTNHRARAFYEAGGWRPDGAEKTDDWLGFRLVEVRYRRDLPA